ncbi:MAG TPA: hypothetical protein VHE55_10100 [Fimbriimonadaceae bacterium]|nr:hypothetical protein [Fimbriimonadaceae bacterium]
MSAAASGSNRLAAVLMHLTRYSFRATFTLAEDTGLSQSCIGKLVAGRTSPRYSTAERIVKCLEAQLGRPLPASEVFSLDGRYPTRFVCQLMNCRPGCLPEAVHDADGTPVPEFDHIERGRWTGDVHEFPAPPDRPHPGRGSPGGGRMDKNPKQAKGGN